MDDVIVRTSRPLGFLHVTNNLDGVSDDRRVVLWEIKVLCCKFMHYWIDLDRRCPDSVSYECCWRCTDAQPSKRRRRISRSIVFVS